MTYLEAIKTGYTILPAKNQILYNPGVIGTRTRIISA